MTKAFYISIICNILFLAIGCYLIHRKGGIEYVKQKVFQKNKSETDVFSKTRKSILEIMPKSENDIIFLGNSLTAFCDWNELFGDSKIKNRGISGDQINDIINRLPSISNSNPKKIFLLIGINDLGKNRSVSQILNDYEILVQIISMNSKTELFLQSILPTKGKKSMKNNDIIDINKGIYNLSIKYRATYINLFDKFKTDKNELNMKYSFDGLHLNGSGYVLWKEILSAYIK